MKKVLIAATALFGSLPGVAVLIKGIGVPEDYKLIFGGIIEVIGGFALLLLYFNRKRIARLSVRSLTKWSVGMIFLFSISLILYVSIAQACLVRHPTHGSVYYPLWITGGLEDLVKRSGGRWSALDRYGNYAILEAVEAQPPSYVIFTTIIFILVYQAIFTSLTIAFGLLAVRKEVQQLAKRGH